MELHKEAALVGVADDLLSALKSILYMRKIPTQPPLLGKLTEFQPQFVERVHRISGYIHNLSRWIDGS
jgi:hypothetical protein